MARPESAKNVSKTLMPEGERAPRLQRPTAVSWDLLGAVIGPDPDDTMPELSTVEAAEIYAMYGVHIIPLKIEPKGNKTEKRPAVKGGFYAGTTDPTAIKSWAPRFQAGGVAIITGCYGHQEKEGKDGAAPRVSYGADIVVIDIDDEKAHAQLVKRLLAQDTWTVKTTRGYHFYFRYPERLPDGVEIASSAGNVFGRGVDVKANYGYVHAPPHATKTLVKATPPATLPGDLLTPLIAHAQRTSAPSARPEPRREALIAEGLESLPRAVQDELWRLDQKGVDDSDRSRAAFAQTALLFTHGYGAESATAVLEDMGGCALEKYGEGLEREVVKCFAKHEARREQDEAAAADLFDAQAVCGPYLTHVYMAQRFAKDWKDKIRFTPGVGWFVWQNTVWRKIDNALARREVEKFCVLVSDHLISAAETKENDKDAQKMQTQARSVCSKPFIDAVFSLASGQESLRVGIDDWDKHAELLCTPGGIVDLRTGALRPADPALLMTKQTAVAPGGDCPKFLAFLDDFTGGDRALQQYVKRIMGFWLTGRTDPHSLFFVVGPGGNGKGVFFDTLERAMGSYAGRMDAEWLMRGNEPHPEWRMRLRGQRLTIVPELPIGGRLNEALLKTLSGETKLTGREMGVGSVEIPLQHKMALTGNHLPVSRDQSDGMKRRVRFIPAKHAVPEEKRDPDLAEKLKPELAGILQLAVEAAATFLADPKALGDRSKLPGVVVETTEDWFESQDVIGMWLKDRTASDRKSWVSYQDLHEDYLSFARAKGERSFISQKSFNQAMRDRNFQPVRRRKGVGVLGIRLVDKQSLINFDAVDL